ncbi:MAG: SH3 domain-containing protein [Hyphomicrobiaceae bacterium]
MGPQLVRWFLMAAGVVAACVMPHDGVRAQSTKGDATGLTVPRFVSLKSDRVNMRSGPGTEYPTLWVYRRVGLPVEVIREVEGWRQIRDSEGSTGWVTQTLLSGRRTAIVLPWEIKPGQALPTAALRVDDSESAEAVAQLEAGVLAYVTGCDGRWCRISVGDLRGYINQARLWGVYPNETVK